jgi:hypothetical protein
MKDSKLILYLNRFEKPAFNRLERFLHSDYTALYPHALKLFAALKKHFPDFEEKEIEREKIFKEVFDGRKFNNQELSNQMKYLVEAIEDFICVEQLKKKKSQKQFLLVEYFRNEDSNLYKESIDKFGAVISKEKNMDSSDSFLAELNFYNEKDLFFSQSELREQNDFIQQKSDSIDTWFAYQKLKTWCEMLNRQNIVSAEYRYSMKDELLKFLKHNNEKILDRPAIRIFYTIFQTLVHPENEKHYHDLISHLEKHENALPRNEVRGMYDFAQNYCIKKLNSGNTAYAEVLFGLYNRLLAKKILLNDNENLSQWDYKNIVALSLRLKKNVWCHHFIEKYKSTIEKSARENAYIYNLSYYYANTENYKEAKRLLQRVEFSDLFYQLGSKSILLRCYYELEDEDSFFSHCESFNKLLLRNKTISDYQRKVHLNLILYTKKAFRLLMRISENKKNVGKKEIESLKTKILQTKQINNLIWLQEKVEELS